MLIKHKVFWIMTPLFLIAALAVVWLVYPPLLQQLQTNRTEAIAAEAALQEQKQYADLVKSLSSQQEQVLSLYQSAQDALPVATSGELVLLQLDGLLQSINLGAASITAPFAAAIPVTASSATPAGEVKPSTQTGANPTSTPIVKSNSQASSNVTIVAETDFATLKLLIEKLRHLARWNKIVSIDLGVGTTKMTATITTQIFTKPDSVKEFVGSDQQFLTKANQLFSGFISYTTKPDASKEGSYGRKDPFAPL